MDAEQLKELNRKRAGQISRDVEQVKQSSRQRVAKISKKTETVLQLADKLERLADQLEGSGLSAIAEKLETFNEKLSGMPEQIASMQSVSDKKLNAWISQVNEALSSIELNPQFQVDAPNVEVTAPSVDLSPITGLISGIEKSINSAVGSIKMPETTDRTDELKEAMGEVRDAINGLVFPVAEFPTTIKVTNPDGSTIAGGSGGGDASAANQTTIIGYLDGVEGLLTTIDADTGNLPTIETNTDFGTVTGGGTETGALRVTVANNSTGVLSVDDNGSTLSVDDGGGSLTVDGTVAVSGTVTVGSHAVTNAGTFAVQAAQSGTWNVGTVTTLTNGGVAHDTADSGNPHKIGTKSVAQLSAQTLVAANDRSNAFSDLDGAVLIREDATLGDKVNGNASNTDGTSTQVLAAGAAGIKHYITDVTLTNTSSSNIYVELKDGATTKWTFPVPANSGVTHSFRTPIGGTAATAWNFDPSAATSTVYCSVSGFKSKV